MDNIINNYINILSNLKSGDISEEKKDEAVTEFINDLKISAHKIYDATKRDLNPNLLLKNKNISEVVTNNYIINIMVTKVLFYFMNSEQNNINIKNQIKEYIKEDKILDLFVDIYHIELNDLDIQNVSEYHREYCSKEKVKIKVFTKIKNKFKK